MTIDTKYFDNIIDQIEGAGSCAALQKIVAESLAAIQSQITALTDQIAALAPLLELLEAPLNPAQLITWAKKVIDNLITPLIAPYYKMAAQLAQLTAKLAEIIAAIEAALPRFPSCDIPLPSV